MYIPAAHNESNPATLFTLIERYSFALLISQNATEPFASHLPLLLDRTTVPHGSLLGHMARANPQWQHAENQSVLAIFPGPHAYISPTWYQSPNVVPTWNYVAVHVYGTFHAIHDAPTLLQILQNTVQTYESPMPTPWTMNPSEDFHQKMLKAIVGFRIQITRIEGKLKLNQNHPLDRQKKVIAALQTSPNQDAQQIAALMSTRIESNNP